MEEQQPNLNFSALKISVASPEHILAWSRGEVTRPETINYRTFKPERDGLFDEKIFGPTKDYECACGKYKRMKYAGIVCDRCGVEVTNSAVRRERMGHITLAAPIAHIWYFKGGNSPISAVTDIPPQTLERIIYYALYLATKVDDEGRKQALVTVGDIKNKDIAQIDAKLASEKDRIMSHFDKEKESLKKKIKNADQLEIATQEVEFKSREQIKTVSEQILEVKKQRVEFYEHIEKTVRVIGIGDVIEEDDYLFLKEHNIADFLTVGMGAEVVYDLLKTIDMKALYTKELERLAKANGERRQKVLKKIRAIENLLKAKIEPSWMILTVLPVLPPDLRPVVQLPGGKFATSDLNDFYRRVINRNNRLRQLIELGAPDIILRNEKRMLQESVDALVDLQKARGRSKGQGGGKVQKSLSDILRGKQGRFRQNLLGKRVDYSGRSTIIAGPELRLDECALPKEMALELFKPHVLHQVLIRGLAPNLKSAKAYIETKDPVVYEILEEVIKNHPVLLNRAPSLHKLSILAFYPKLTDDYAIKLHPAVCAGFNADFDGDAMSVFVPLSQEAIAEVKEKMIPYHNLLKPADGSPIVLPNKEMALGCFYLTSFDTTYQNIKDEKLKYFASIDEVLTAFNFSQITLRQPIWTITNGNLVKTSAGRVMFNNAIPAELRFINNEMKASDVKSLIVKAMKMYDDKTVGGMIDALKDVGFWGATQASGLSVSIFDCEIIDDKNNIVAETDKKVSEINANYQMGLLTQEEKQRLSNAAWMETTEVLADKTWAQLDEENPVKLIIRSGGARASREQLKQLCAIKGLVVDPMGKIIEVPTKSNYREGLSIFEYVTSTRGARKGLADSALKTADAGYLTRRLHDVAHDVIIKEEDSQMNEGLLISRSGPRGDKFYDRIFSRFVMQDIVDKNGKIVVAKDTLLMEEEIEKIKELGTDSILVYSPLFSRSKDGICAKSYGADLTNHKAVQIGTPVGVLSAQSIGEPGTQLTMRVRHFGGIVINDVTQGLPRVEELLEARTPKVVSPISEINGKITIVENNAKDVYEIHIESTGKGKSQQQDFIVPLSQKLKVKDGDIVSPGQQLSEGYLDINTILMVKGLTAAQQYLVDEIQKVYESQGISIHDKHFEVIVRKMSDKVVIEDEADTQLVKDEIVSRARFEDENRKALALGGRPAVGKMAILGITRAALYTDSWLSAVSFEQTTSALVSAATKGQVDQLKGLKENVIIGRLIPVTEELVNKYTADRASATNQVKVIESANDVTASAETEVSSEVTSTI